MKDRRLQDYRVAVDVLVESLDAVVRVARWNGDEAPPEPLVTAVTRLGERRAAAEKLTATPFVGRREDIGRVTALADSLKRLETAYQSYSTRLADEPTAVVSAAADLEHDITEATAT